MEAFSWVTQDMGAVRDESQATEVLGALSLLEGFMGGRVLRPGRGRAAWFVQAFFPDMGEGAVYPEGMRRVLAPRALLDSLGAK